MATITFRFDSNDWDRVAVAVQNLVTQFPEFGYSSVIAGLTDRTASTVYKQMEQRGITLQNSTKQDRMSLSNVALELLFSEKSATEIVEALELVKAVIASADISDLIPAEVDPLA